MTLALCTKPCHPQLTDFIVDTALQVTHSGPALLLLDFWVIVKYFIS